MMILLYTDLYKGIVFTQSIIVNRLCIFNCFLLVYICNGIEFKLIQKAIIIINKDLSIFINIQLLYSCEDWNNY